MTKGIRICKVCGKEYPYCRTERKSTIFRYQDVACCPEHGSIYLARINESRGITRPVAEDNIPEEPVVIFADADYEDDDFDDWDDDTDDSEWDDDIEDE